MKLKPLNILDVGEKKIKIRFMWYDLWIGVYYDTKKRIVYICPLPTIVIIIKLRPK